MQTSKFKAITLLSFAALGFIDATYLTVQHFLGKIPPCAVTSGCEAVLTSSWSVILGIPVSLIGCMYYLTMIILAIIYLNTDNRKILILAAWFTIVGFATSLGLVYLQFFVLQHICFYCMISATISTLLFITGMITVFSLRKTGLQTDTQKIA